MELSKELQTAQPFSDTLVSGIELEHNGEYHYWDILHNDKYIFVGGMCNSGLIVDSYMELDQDFSMDENLQAVVEYIQERLVNGEQLEREIVF